MCLYWESNLGQTPIKQRLEEIESAVESGATEIDIVISRAYVLEANWEALYNEVKAMRKACGDAHLKTIIATGTILHIMLLQTTFFRLIMHKYKNVEVKFIQCYRLQPFWSPW